MIADAIGFKGAQKAYRFDLEALGWTKGYVEVHFNQAVVMVLRSDGTDAEELIEENQSIYDHKHITMLNSFSAATKLTHKPKVMTYMQLAAPTEYVQAWNV